MPVMYNFQDNYGLNMELNVDYLFNSNIKHTGFNSPHEFAEALKSPHHNPIKEQYENRILRAIINLEIQKRNKNQMINEKILNKQRRLAEILAMSKKEYKKHKREVIMANEALDDWFLEQEAKIIQENAQANSKTVNPKFVADAYRDMAKNYGAQHQALSEILDSQKKELETLEAETDLLDEQYDDYENALDDIEARIQAIADSMGKDTNVIEKELSDIETDLQETIDKDTNEITAMVDKGDYDGARLIIQQQNTRNLQISILHDLKGFIKGTHIAYDANGEIAKSFFDSEFIIDTNQKIDGGVDKQGKPVQMTLSDKKIVRVDNEYYLINKNTNIKELSASPELKNKAKNDFDKLEPTIKTVKKLIPETKKRAINFLRHKKDNLQVEMQEIMKQLSKLDSAKSRALKMASDVKNGKINIPLNAMGNPITPGISSSPSLSPVANRMLVNTLSMVRSIKVNENNNSTIIFNKSAKPHILGLKQDIGGLLQDKSLAHYHPGLKLAYQNLVGSEHGGTGQIIPGAPTSPIRMARILEGLNRFGVDASLPGMHGITQLEELAEAAAMQKAEKKWDHVQEVAEQKLERLKENDPSLEQNLSTRDNEAGLSQENYNDYQEKNANSTAPTPFDRNPKAPGG